MNLHGNISTLTLVFRTGFKDTSFRVCQTGGVQNFWKTVCSAAFLNVPANIFFCTFFLAVGNLDNSKLSWQAWDCRRTAPCWDPLFAPQVYFRVLRVFVCLGKKKKSARVHLLPPLNPLLNWYLAPIMGIFQRS